MIPPNKFKIQQINKIKKIIIIIIDFNNSKNYAIGGKMNNER